MLAVYHLASRNVSADKLEGVPPVLDEAKIHDLQRTIKENCNVLGFSNAEFEPGGDG